MSLNGNKKKSEQLGMPHGTANGKLRKSIIFHLLKETKRNICFQCGEPINTLEDLSIEHKVPWLDSNDAIGLFFDINNIAFSHLNCNIKAGKRYIGRRAEHGTYSSYCYG